MLETRTYCPNCHASELFAIQFKYGFCRLYTLHAGDAVSWGNGAYGMHVDGSHDVDGIGRSCPTCKTDYLEFSIRFDGDTVIGVR